MVIAIDFDGTIVEDAYPEIGEPKLFALETLQTMVKNHHQLILWTTREGRALQEAVDFCAKHNVEFYAINKSYPDERFEDIGSRKIICDLFISNKNFGTMPGWGEMWQLVNEMEKGPQNESELPAEGFLGRLKKMFQAK